MSVVRDGRHGGVHSQQFYAEKQRFCPTVGAHDSLRKLRTWGTLLAEGTADPFAFSFRMCLERRSGRGLGLPSFPVGGHERGGGERDACSRYGPWLRQ